MYSSSRTTAESIAGWTFAPRRVAWHHAEGHGVHRRSMPWFNELIPNGDGTIFELQRNNELLASLGLRQFRARPVFWQPERCALSDEIKSGVGDRYAILVPGSRIEEKKWPADRYVELITSNLALSTFPWILCGDESDRPVAEAIMLMLEKRGTKAVSTAGLSALPDLIPMVRNASFCLGGDTALMHIAAAFDIHSVVLVGGGQYGRFFPYPQPSNSIAVTNHLPCFGCDWECTRDAPDCVREITVSQVSAAVHIALENEQPRTMLNLRATDRK